MRESDKPHIYGAPDRDNRQPPAEQGLRGEQGAPEPARSDLAHEETTPDGRGVTLAEQSGTAFAEVTGKAGGKDRGVTRAKPD